MLAKRPSATAALEELKLMKKMTWFKGAFALALMTGVSMAFAADHIDAPAATADPTSDITDLYTWVDGTNAVFVLNVTPLAAMGAKFSDKVQYVVHTESSPGFGQAGTPLDIICTFAADQTISCWVGTKDYVTGDAKGVAGLASKSGLLTVFAGLRDDPFFFNLDGFKDTVATVDAAKAGLMLDSAGCPAINAATSAVLVSKLKTDPNSVPPGGVAKDFFAGKNVLSIVISVDKKLVTAGGAYVSSWASTNVGS
jgi:hypothetical protein